MKENKLLIVKSFLIIFIIIITIIFANKREEHYITEYDYLYDTAIEYIKEKEQNRIDLNDDKEDYNIFITYDPLGITEDKEYKYAYMWVLLEGYYIDNNKIEMSSGYSVFHKITFQGNKVVNVEIPEDGSLYKKSIIKMCPDKALQKKVLSYNLKMTLDDQVEQYYHDKIK